MGYTDEEMKVVARQLWEGDNTVSGANLPDKIYAAGVKSGYELCKLDNMTNRKVWHYIKDNDFPPEKEVLVFIRMDSAICPEEPTYGYDLGIHHKNGGWVMDVFKEEDNMTKVIAWAELPEPPVEIK